jgi:endonuclease/exonuclease/phosphatase family metal-dependent hydrolase
MPVFPKPSFVYAYDVQTQIASLRAHRQTPDRLIPAKDPARMLLATWNIANFGAQDRRDSEFQLLAEILSWFDVAAIQECRENFSHLEQVHSRLPASYRLLFTDIAGNQERMAFLYDSSKLTLLEKIGEISIPPADLANITLPGLTQAFRGFDRNPYLATFKVGQTDFMFVNVHLYFGSTQSADIQRRSLETFAVARWADQRRRSAFSFTKEIVALGDFNMPKAAPGDAVFEALTAKGLELPDHSSIIGSSIASDAQYDQVAFFPGSTALKFTGKKGVFDYDKVVFPDLWQARGQMDFNAYLRYYISDHRPMWLEFNVT